MENGLAGTAPYLPTSLPASLFLSTKASWLQCSRESPGRGLRPCAGQSGTGRRDSQATAGEGKAKRDASLAVSPLCTQKASPEPLGPAQPAGSLLPGHVLTTCSRLAWRGGAASLIPVDIPVLPPNQLTARQGTGVRTVTAPIFQVAEVKGHHLLQGGSSQSVLI